MSEKTGSAVSLQFADGGKEGLVSDRKIPDGDPLIQKTADDPEENRMHQGVQVHLIFSFPDGPEFADSRRWPLQFLGKYFFFPLIKALDTVSLRDNPFQNVLPDTPSLIKGPVFG